MKDRANVDSSACEKEIAVYDIFSPMLTLLCSV
jgi:hypothetical protein